MSFFPTSGESVKWAAQPDAHDPVAQVLDSDEGERSASKKNDSGE